ncbi:hypothetical protein GCM10027079_07280 [Sediminivirga luteola]|uniref:CAAX prenyl protease 2/Lysostaphin resistance protein A-like domain-containing protein n=2 Tax=Sediminivirga luteola TaxID=1774748 RepID=A0A8J2U0X5_9MICO|nr:hypothetical protein GCM10011333_31960 [Sediminivirga luteola]
MPPAGALPPHDPAQSPYTAAPQPHVASQSHATPQPYAAPHPYDDAARAAAGPPPGNPGMAPPAAAPQPYATGPQPYATGPYGQPGAAPQPYASATVPPPPPPEARGYTQFYRTPRNRWWKGLVSIVVVLTVFLVASLILGLIAMLIDAVTGASDPEALMSGEVSMTPLLLLSVNLTVIVTALLTALLHVFLHRQPLGTWHSVTGRFRWRWFGTSALVIVPMFLLYVGVFTFLDPGSSSWSVDGTAIAFLVVVLLTTPFQSAGEEYLFRGVIQRAAGSWASGPTASLILGTAVSAVAFSLMHFAADVWLIVYYLIVGVTMSLLTQVTGGLESSVLMHAVNNTLLFIPAIFLGQMDSGFDRSAGTGGPIMLIPMAVFIVVSAAVAAIAWRKKIARTGLPPATA